MSESEFQQGADGGIGATASSGAPICQGAAASAVASSRAEAAPGEVSYLVSDAVPLASLVDVAGLVLGTGSLASMATQRVQPVLAAVKAADLTARMLAIPAPPPIGSPQEGVGAPADTMPEWLTFPIGEDAVDAVAPTVASDVAQHATVAPQAPANATAGVSRDATSVSPAEAAASAAALTLLVSAIKVEEVATLVSASEASESEQVGTTGAMHAGTATARGEAPPLASLDLSRRGQRGGGPSGSRHRAASIASAVSPPANIHDFDVQMRGGSLPSHAPQVQSAVRQGFPGPPRPAALLQAPDATAIGGGSRLAMAHGSIAGTGEEMPVWPGFLTGFAVAMAIGLGLFVALSSG